MSNVLAPCPFCGSPADFSPSADGELVNVRCVNWRPGTCLGAGANCHTHELAAAAWNRHVVSSIAEKRGLTTLSELRDTLHPEIVSRAGEEYARQAAAGKRESLGFRAGRQRLFDLIESMTGFTCLEDDMSEIEQVVLSYASDLLELQP